MNEATPSPKDAATLADMVVALEEMRDALVAASLALRDYQFEVDRAGRDQALAAARALIDRLEPTGK